VLRAATADAATTLGLLSAIGTIENGKLADFLVYPPGVDLLHGDIRKTRQLKYVVRGGRVWEAATMEQVWPVKKGAQTMPPLNPE
jgi:imidazolonepropionase-like amidohydrolase